MDFKGGSLIYLFYLVWSLVAEKVRCAGANIGLNTGVNIGLARSVDSCANKCKGKSSMFIFGTNLYGRQQCWGASCICYCEVTATPDGQCDHVTHRGYKLYKFVAKGRVIIP